MDEEVLRIMKMVEEGKLTAKEAEKLIDALNISTPAERGGRRFFKINIEDSKGDRVNVALPLGLVKFARKFIPDKELERLEAKGIDLDDIVDTLETGDESELVNVQSANGETIKIWIE